MLNNDQIIIGNSLIADFLELPKSQTEVYPDEHFFKSNNISTEGYPRIIFGYIIGDELRESFYESDDDGFRTKESLEYHSSWDWLMPVLIKIVSLSKFYDSPISNNFYMEGNPLAAFSVCHEFDVNFTKENIWEYCVEFLEWYNNQIK